MLVVFDATGNKKEGGIMHQKKRITAKRVRRDPNVKKLSRALILLAQARAEKEAQGTVENLKEMRPTS